jgi:hypothetical protein
MEEKFSSIKKIHDEVKFGVCLECVVELYDERTADFLKDISFSYTNFISMMIVWCYPMF